MYLFGKANEILSEMTVFVYEYLPFKGKLKIGRYFSSSYF